MRAAAIVETRTPTGYHPRELDELKALYQSLNAEHQGDVREVFMRKRRQVWEDQFPNLQKAMALLDMTVLADVATVLHDPEEGEYAYLNYETVPVVYLGAAPEYGAGQMRVVFSPCFWCEELLEQFCKEMMPRIETIAAGQVLPSGQWWKEVSL